MKANKHKFSRKHWMIIALGFMIFFIYNAVASDGMNVIVPQLAADRGWDYEYVLSFATIAGVISAVLSVFFGKLCEKKGPRFMIGTSMLLAAVFFYMYGHATSIPMYVVALCGVTSCSSSFGFIGVSSLVANWFPTKKGIAQGFASMGCPFSSMISVALFTVAFNKFGLGISMTFFAVLMAVIAVILLIILRNTPEECGEYPDSIPPSERTQAELDLVSNEKGKTIGQMAKVGTVWYVGIFMGLYSMCSLGVMGQFVVRHSELPIDNATVLLMFSVCAAAGIFGGPLWGAIDTKFGTKTGYLLCALNYIVAMLLNFTDIMPLVYISVVLLGLGACGIQVFLAAWLVSIFGRKDFAGAYGIAYPLSNILCQMCFFVIAFTKSVFGQMRYAYLVFVALLVISIIMSRFVKINYKKD
jgi:OFA family oxalate/formate antiporter-like MFS transporter